MHAGDATILLKRDNTPHRSITLDSSQVFVRVRRHHKLGNKIPYNRKTTIRKSSVRRVIQMLFNLSCEWLNHARFTCTCFVGVVNRNGTLGEQDKLFTLNKKILAIILRTKLSTLRAGRLQRKHDLHIIHY